MQFRYMSWHEGYFVKDVKMQHIATNYDALSQIGTSREGKTVTIHDSFMKE
jgi:hypothetical protein